MPKGSKEQARSSTKTKGKIKQAVGHLTGNKRLKREGERDGRKAKAKAR